VRRALTRAPPPAAVGPRVVFHLAPTPAWSGGRTGPAGAFQPISTEMSSMRPGLLPACGRGARTATAVSPRLWAGSRWDSLSRGDEPETTHRASALRAGRSTAIFRTSCLGRPKKASRFRRQCGTLVALLAELASTRQAQLTRDARAWSTGRSATLRSRPQIVSRHISCESHPETLRAARFASPLRPSRCSRRLAAARKKGRARAALAAARLPARDNPISLRARRGVPAATWSRAARWRRQESDRRRQLFEPVSRARALGFRAEIAIELESPSPRRRLADQRSRRSWQGRSPRWQARCGEIRK